MADTDTLLVAKTFFDLGEYSRCAHALSSHDAMPASHNPKEVFLWGYAKYLAGERRKEEEMAETTDPTDSCKVSIGLVRV
jgi:anaphase-promoting complex subunit 8